MTVLSNLFVATKDVVLKVKGRTSKIKATTNICWHVFYAFRIIKMNNHLYTSWELDFSVQIANDEPSYELIAIKVGQRLSLASFLHKLLTFNQVRWYT